MWRATAIAAVLGTVLAIALAWWSAMGGPNYLLSQGLDALENENFDEARRRSLQLQTGGHVEYAVLLEGHVLFHKGQFLEAIRVLNQVKTEQALVQKAAALAGQAYLKLEHFLGAESCFLFLLAQDANNIDAHRGLAAAYYDLNALDHAVHHSLQWSRLNERDGRPHRFVALIYKDLSQLDSAVAHYEKALERRLTDTVRRQVRMEMAECHLLLHKHDKALSILEADPADGALRPLWLLLKAEGLRALAKYDEAQKTLDELSALEKPLPRALRLQGQLFLDINKPKEAAAWLQKAVEQDAKDFTSAHLLVQAYGRLGQYHEAKDLQRRVDELQKLFVSLTELTQSVIAEPRDPARHLQLAECYRKLGMKELAERFERNSKQLQSKFP
ncbi:MAG: tetratricopeptide repeat protein [Gemmataceae bacterium]|nr:tetratricopeptide repeat protein [Gemmataceae bacterium]